MGKKILDDFTAFWCVLTALILGVGAIVGLLYTLLAAPTVSVVLLLCAVTVFSVVYQLEKED